MDGCFQKELWITKGNQARTAEVDIRSGIYDCHIDDGALVFMVDASSGGNIRPEFVTDAVLSLAGLEASKIELQTVRMETWMNTGTKEEPSFVPLDAIGEAFLSSVCVITRAVLKEHTEPVLTSFLFGKGQTDRGSSPSGGTVASGKYLRRKSQACGKKY